MIIVLGISKQEDFDQAEKPLEETREIDNEARISKKAEMKTKLNRNHKRLTLWDIQLSYLTSLVWYQILLKFTAVSRNTLQFKKLINLTNHLVCKIIGFGKGIFLQALMAPEYWQSLKYPWNNVIGYIWDKLLWKHLC